MTNLDSIFRSRDITLPTKVCLLKAMVFPVVMMEEEMATHYSILAWEIPWTEEPGRLQFMGSQRSDTTEQLTFTRTLKPF